MYKGSKKDFFVGIKYFLSKKKLEEKRKNMGI